MLRVEGTWPNRAIGTITGAKPVIEFIGAIPTSGLAIAQETAKALEMAV